MSESTGLSVRSGFRKREQTGMTHEEIVSQQSEELRDLLRSPSVVPEFDFGGNLRVLNWMSGWVYVQNN